ncbi:8198_t:CDS:1 [Entrophospora sp. SA101]|nr:756_t:CDS:1 [Entrophospora sp. SA101]CAJ0764723.1 21886_t:CDS:1 [Entrophospora sp. SA101]CAJ0767799.1 8198_t:CDS:1 [Entrophospora sp. SA101]CAJ0829988.1 5656_t:CDS:1 [Entrophospora sp. SA101]CAJ0839732.1 15399_t:CDS:1 [Entrophospora sp. SA101]
MSSKKEKRVSNSSTNSNNSNASYTSIWSIESDSSTNSSKPLGFHGTSHNSVESIIRDGFKKQSQQGLWPHEKGLYMSPDLKVAGGYGATQDGHRVKPGVVLAVSIPRGTPHVETYMPMANRRGIKNQMDIMDKKFGEGNYSVTGPQSSENRAKETITKFPIASKAKSQKLSKQPTLDTMGNFEPGSDIRKQHQVKPTHEVVSVKSFATISKVQRISFMRAFPENKKFQKRK